jgi:hypothetical protein
MGDLTEIKVVNDDYTKNELAHSPIAKTEDYQIAISQDGNFVLTLDTSKK